MNKEIKLSSTEIVLLREALNKLAYERRQYINFLFSSDPTTSLWFPKGKWEPKVTVIRKLNCTLPAIHELDMRLKALQALQE